LKEMLYIDVGLGGQHEVGRTLVGHPDGDLEAPALFGEVEQVGGGWPLVEKRWPEPLPDQGVEPVVDDDESAIGILREVCPMIPWRLIPWSLGDGAGA